MLNPSDRDKQLHSDYRQELRTIFKKNKKASEKEEPVEEVDLSDDGSEKEVSLEVVEEKTEDQPDEKSE